MNDDEEWLLSKVSETVDSKVEEYKENMPPELRYLLENYEEGVPLNNLLNILILCLETKVHLLE